MMVPKAKAKSKLNSDVVRNFLFPAIATGAFVAVAVFFYSAFNDPKLEEPAAVDNNNVVIRNPNQESVASTTAVESLPASSTSDASMADNQTAKAGSVKKTAPIAAIPAAPIAHVAKPVAVPTENSGVRDEQRQADMRRLAGAQNYWHGDHKRYYTCSTAGGDCRGKINNLPTSIGSANGVVDPLNSGRVCGRDYTYCGLDNTRNSREFCYYAKLEAGGYYGVSSKGTFKAAILPLNLAECSAAALFVSPKTDEPQKTTPQERDMRRQSDMLQLSIAQSSWYGQKSRYYTCGENGGDCLGRPGSYPLNLGFAMIKTPLDPINSGGVCGQGLIYCGLDNSQTPVKFCYFCKLETGGYYAVSNSGSFKRSTAPINFGECGQPN